MPAEEEMYISEYDSVVEAIQNVLAGIDPMMGLTEEELRMPSVRPTVPAAPEETAYEKAEHLIMPYVIALERRIEHGIRGAYGEGVEGRRQQLADRAMHTNLSNRYLSAFNAELDEKERVGSIEEIIGEDWGILAQRLSNIKYGLQAYEDVGATTPDEGRGSALAATRMQIQAQQEIERNRIQARMAELQGEIQEAQMTTARASLGRIAPLGAPLGGGGRVTIPYDVAMEAVRRQANWPVPLPSVAKEVIGGP